MKDQAYFVAPPTSGPGSGVLFLPAWWGLTRSARRRADFLSDAGFTVLAPDLALGEQPETEEEAERVLGEADPNRLASLVLSSADLLAEKAAGPLGVVGVGMGGSLGLWLSVRRPGLVTATVSMYGSQVIDFAGARADYQIHLAEQDRFISDDEAVFMEATIGMESLDVTVESYPGTRHGFADPESPAFDPVAADLAWERTRAFLRARL